MTKSKKKVCKVCGTPYKACLTVRKNNTFRWRDVACSPECGSEYLKRIRISRGLDAETGLAVQKNDRVISDKVIMCNEDYNGFDSEPDDEYIDEFGSDE